ncbi:putative toxin-antitoxin system toxin component, PIN family [Candidatus Berkelbacteria bacterium CG_4_10_14_0_8_um_filter_42_34]|uniref:Putative toxin-antitoxin system toxin component, PIN family n=2 Tax=Candidatus Berkelbacteria TaxID=1618330 RepID=A0A2M7K1K2_9BACT|nr:MAG: putative toxin-antitoxin system toxin component, PIN family [Candidatus Berkelbacteria bacterium CG_4_8_14_3_um_filter_42_13]PIZ27890.1 MAG: putative toxin-antitoxin system toxin component, PIN family [Candidatus Berkelbacteria bacterium CG_4_10_14_0_8_um_filter_42_34]
MKVVLDTNIYLSGLIFSNSNPALILDFARRGKFELYCSDFIIREIRRNLIIKFGYDEIIAEQFIEEILKISKIIIVRRKVEIIKVRKDDNRILECALAAKADYLITGDKKHILPLGKIAVTKIISAAEFIEKLK